MDATRRDELLRVRAIVRERVELLAQRTDARAAASKLNAELAHALAGRMRMQREVDRITRGVRGWLIRRLGTPSLLPDLQTALAAARDAHEGLAAENVVLRARLRKIEETLDRMGDVEARYAELLVELERAAVASGSPHATALVELAESHGRLRAARRALDDTIAAGHATQLALEKAVRLTAMSVAAHGTTPFRIPAHLAAIVRPASEGLAELRRQASGAAALIPGIDLSRIRGTELAGYVRFSIALAPTLVAELARMNLEVRTLLTALRGHDRAMRDAESALVTERERVVDLIRERL